jgi:hypothetical protein
MKITWNFYSGIVAPILVLIAVLLLLIFSVNQPFFSLYFFPFILLGIVMIKVLIFWTTYMLYIRKKISKRIVIKLGKSSIKLGRMLLIILIIMTFLKLISYFAPLDLFEYKVDNNYWLISIWTFIEIIHHYTYKLIHDRKKAFFEIVNNGDFNDLTLPFGGAIGIAVKKLSDNDRK